MSAPLDLLYIAIGSDAIDLEVLQELLGPLLERVRDCSNLMFFDAFFGDVVEYGYPMSGGQMIWPGGVEGYLDRRRIGFQCPHFSIIETSFEFLTFETHNRETWLVCGFCGFEVSLNEKFHTTYFPADYLGYPRDSPRLVARSAQVVDLARSQAQNRLVTRRTRSSLLRPRGLAATRSRRVGIEGSVVRNQRARSTLGRIIADPNSPRTPVRRPSTRYSSGASSCSTWSPPSPTLLINRISSQPRQNAVAGPSSAGGSGGDPSGGSETEPYEICEDCGFAIPSSRLADHVCQ
ncbi:hypothetical protein M422DRAFT_252087 [Sphaerobolus stellatus SS14]|uniref:Uncharacterized protein n=1 Tax=Sphaerobolus stellatus (strain SS14) TaxID=990650 RepID=A0A0C9UNB8_SPHS4|nr:hypothetical protein M422DRAFT_252087 [Sphaerobolus stellatus SS14]